MDIHSNIKPFIYWFEYNDPAMGEDEESKYFYQAIILAESEYKAKSWGDKCAMDYCSEEKYQFLSSSWIEDISFKILSNEGYLNIKWENLKNEDIENFFQGTAESRETNVKNYNILINATSDDDAKKLFIDHLNSKKNKFIFSTCSKAVLSITKYGEKISW
jgi:hypothetical protein